MKTNKPHLTEELHRDKRSVNCDVKNAMCGLVPVSPKCSSLNQYAWNVEAYYLSDDLQFFFKVFKKWC